LAIGVDVGGTSLRAALVDERGKIARAVRRPLEERDPQKLLDQLDRLIVDLAVTKGPLPICVGLAAIIRVESGLVAVAPNLGWRDVPIGDMLAERYGRPVRLVNDLNAISVGEAACGAGRGAKDVVCVFVGTGVGMGAVIQGAMLEGSEGFATELGHIKIESVDTGRRCGCGERGCLEAYTSGRHLPDLLAAKVAHGVPSRLLDEVRGDLKALTADRIEAAAGAGDRAAVELWEEIGVRLGRAIGNLITVLNPRAVVLGGGVLLAAPSLRKRVVTQLERYAGRQQLGSVAVRDSELGDHAGLVGAGLLAHGWRG
jgi:glucokinase